MRNIILLCIFQLFFIDQHLAQAIKEKSWSIHPEFSIGFNLDNAVPTISTTRDINFETIQDQLFIETQPTFLNLALAVEYQTGPLSLINKLNFRSQHYSQKITIAGEWPDILVQEHQDVINGNFNTLHYQLSMRYKLRSAQASPFVEAGLSTGSLINYKRKHNKELYNKNTFAGIISAGYLWKMEGEMKWKFDLEYQYHLRGILKNGNALQHQLLANIGVLLAL